MSNSILSVNGNRAMNYVLQTIFEKDYGFIPVMNVYQAASCLRSKKGIKVIIVDVDFQPQQSWEFIEHIKSSKLFQTSVIVLTTATTEDIQQKCYELQIEEMFFKPFNPVDVITAVKSIMSLTLHTV